MNQGVKAKSSLVVLVIFALLFNGCMAAPLVVAGAGLAITGTQLYNYARNQYPDIDFESVAPLKVTYQESQGRVWNALIDTLQEMQENFAVVDKNSGVARTESKSFNDVSWVGKGLGKATFRYVYNIICRDSAVKIVVNFTEEKFFSDSKEKNIPEGSNMMRHILFRNLQQKLTPIAEEFSNDPSQGYRTPPVN